MANALHCPAGHQMKACAATLGFCDPRGKLMLQDEWVTECRRCNYYLCKGRKTSKLSVIWDTVSSLLADISCHAPDKGQLSVEELLIETQPTGDSSTYKTGDSSHGVSVSRRSIPHSSDTVSYSSPGSSVHHASVDLLGLDEELVHTGPASGLKHVPLPNQQPILVKARLGAA